MAKRSTQIEVTKTLINGKTITTLNKNKMNARMCEEIIKRLSEDWKETTTDTSITDVKFKCVG
jgi:hypothetical protein